MLTDLRGPAGCRVDVDVDRVTPPELGPVEVRIDLSNGEASFAIVATQPATRDALEQALPLLRDLLAAQGLTLGQASVHDGRPESQGNGSPGSAYSHSLHSVNRKFSG